MSYRVRFGVHAESLRGGRMVGPGDQISDAEALENLHLIDRGVIAEVEPEEEESPAPGIKATSTAKKLAAENGIELELVEGTGAGGQVKEDDVKKAIEAAAAAAAAGNPGGDNADQKSPEGERGGAQ